MDVNVLCMNDTRFDLFACNHSAQRMDKVWSLKPTSHIVHNFGEGGQVSRPTTIDKVPGEWCLSDDQLLALSCNCSQTLYLAFISFSMVFVEVRASFPLHIKPTVSALNSNCIVPMPCVASFKRNISIDNVLKESECPYDSMS